MCNLRRPFCDKFPLELLGLFTGFGKSSVTETAPLIQSHAVKVLYTIKHSLFETRGCCMSGQAGQTPKLTSSSFDLRRPRYPGR